MIIELTMKIPIIVTISNVVTDIKSLKGILLPDHLIYTFSHENMKKIFEIKNTVRRSQSLADYIHGIKFEALNHPWTGTADGYITVSAYNFYFCGQIKKENLTHHWRSKHFLLYDLIRIREATEKDIPLLINDKQIIVREYAKQYLKEGI